MIDKSPIRRHMTRQRQFRLEMSDISRLRERLESREALDQPGKRKFWRDKMDRLSRRCMQFLLTRS
jgi:hypothetical protein